MKTQMTKMTIEQLFETLKNYGHDYFEKNRTVFIIPCSTQSSCFRVLDFYTFHYSNNVVSGYALDVYDCISGKVVEFTYSPVIANIPVELYQVKSLDHENQKA